MVCELLRSDGVECRFYPRTALVDICGVPEKNQNGGSYLVGTPRTLLRKMEKQAGVRTSCQSVRSL